MTEKIVPELTRRAAKRAFVRTTAQSLAATLSAGITASTALAFVQDFDILTSGIILGVAVLAPPIAGAAAYFDILSKGIPEDYQY